jgi:uncharacterized glyoxalase superfamily protein PhnB
MDQPYPNAVHLTVADIKKSIKFFTEKLGFTFENSFPNLKKPVWASLTLDRQRVMLGTSMSADDAKKFDMSKAEIDMVKKDAKAFAKGAHGVGAVFYICVPDVDAHCKAAKKKKVEILSPPKTQFYGLREYVARDPDGYRFVFYTRVAADMPMGDAGRPSTTTTQPGEKEEEAVADA